jgi:hypothetical protein
MKKTFTTAVALLALAPAGAAAQDASFKPAGFAGTPALAGERVLWTLGPGLNVELWSGTAGASPVRVQTFAPEAPPGGRQYLSATLAASPSLAAVTAFAYRDIGPGAGRQPEYTEQYVGPPGGPLERVAWCPAEQNQVRSADVSGEAYVYRQCDEGEGHVEIRDFGAEPLSGSAAVGRGGYFARIAGRYVAWLDGVWQPETVSNTADLVVYDRVAGTEVYRVGREDIGRTLHSLDVQSDGKIAFSYETDARSEDRVVGGWASPAEPYVHRLPLPERGEYDVKIVDDRIAFQAGHSQGFTIQHADIGLSDLSGNTRLLARRTDAYVFNESFDYDGERVTWSEYGCERRRLVVRAVNEPGTAKGAPRNCPLRMLAKPRVTRGVAVFRFGCGGFLRPCSFMATLRAAGRKVGHIGRERAARNPVRVRLSRAGRRVLEQRGSLRVELTVRLMAPTGHEQVRRKTVRLRG